MSVCRSWVKRVRPTPPVHCTVILDVRNTGARPHIEHGWSCSLLQQQSLRKVESKSALSAAALLLLPLFFFLSLFVLHYRQEKSGTSNFGNIYKFIYRISFLPWKFQFDMWTFASIPGSARDKFMPSPFIIHHV